MFLVFFFLVLPFRAMTLQVHGSTFIYQSGELEVVIMLELEHTNDQLVWTDGLSSLVLLKAKKFPYGL